MFWCFVYSTTHAWSCIWWRCVCVSSLHFICSLHDISDSMEKLRKPYYSSFAYTTVECIALELFFLTFRFILFGFWLIFGFLDQQDLVDPTFEYTTLELEKNCHIKILFMDSAIKKKYRLICMRKKTKLYHCFFWNQTLERVLHSCGYSLLFQKKIATSKYYLWMVQSKKTIVWSA